MIKTNHFTVILVGLFMSDNFISVISDRRIHNGTDPAKDMPFMVYLVAAESAPVKYDEWICGGVIVTEIFIITSAACVEDVQHMYAISGTKNYTRSSDINSNSCARATKKRVTETCVPKAYNLNYEKIEIWSNIDIALARVESPYNLNEQTARDGCDYAPKSIRINYNLKYQRPDVDVGILGWGHESVWRQPQDTRTYNRDTLKFSTLKIIDKDICKTAYKSVSAGMPNIIEKYMICANGEGSIDSSGTILEDLDDGSEKDGCNATSRLRDGVCIEDRTRKKNSLRKNGICQNDHGGPLIGWIGSGVALLGVASVFKISSINECEGPYLFTSTHCNSQFLKCVLNAANPAASSNVPPPSRLKYPIDYNDRTKRKNSNDSPMLVELKNTYLRNNTWKTTRRIVDITKEVNIFVHDDEESTTQTIKDKEKKGLDDKSTTKLIEENTKLDLSTERSTPKYDVQTEKLKLHVSSSTAKKSTIMIVKDILNSRSNNVTKEIIDNENISNNTEKTTTKIIEETMSTFSFNTTERSTFKTVQETGKIYLNTAVDGSRHRFTEEFDDIDESKILRSGFDPAVCSQPAALRGFDMVQTIISWKNHPNGPADNEVYQNRQGHREPPSYVNLKRRPQVPLNKFWG